jgi:type I restriction enzyme S subunit
MAKTHPEQPEPEDTGDETRMRWDVPIEWYWARVADVGNVKLGRQLSSTKRPKTKPTPYLRTANITLRGLRLDDVQKMDLTDQERESFRLIKGDVVLADSSGSPAQVGRSALWNDEIPECCFQNHIIRFRPHAVVPEYALLVFQHLRAASIFARVSHGVGILHLGAARFAELEIPIPSMTEQARIVEEGRARLDHVAQAAQRLDSALSGIEDQVAAVLEAAATGQLTTGTETAPPRTKLPTTTVEPLSKVAIPESWEWTTVKAVGETRLGRQRAPKHEQGKNLVPYLRVANVFEARIDTTDVLSMNFTPEEQEIYRLQKGDILLNEGQSAELVGRPALYEGDPPSVCFQNTLVRFRPGKDVRPAYALVVFRFYLRAGVFRAIAKWSTNIAHLGMQRFIELPFPLPPLEVQDEIAAATNEKIAQLQEQRDSIKASLAGIDQMRSEVLSTAVSGGLSNREAGDEPAEAMILRLGPPPKETRATRTKSAGEDEESGTAEDHQDLVGALMERGGSATAEDLFASAGYDRDLTTEVATFYLTLRDTLGKTIVSAGAKGGSVVLEVAPDAN